MRGLTLANSGSQVGELSMQHAHPRILHPKISLCMINVLIWLVTLHMVSYSGVLWKNCVRPGAPMGDFQVELSHKKFPKKYFRGGVVTNTGDSKPFLLLRKVNYHVKILVV